MRYKDIIRDSWEFTQHNKRLTLWYGFLPALLKTIAGILYILYQFFAFKRSPLFENADKSFLWELTEIIFKILNVHSYINVPLILTVLILGIAYLILPTILEGGLIQVIARIKNKQRVTVGDGIYYGMLSFLTLFKFHLMIKIFSLFTIIGQAMFIVRNLGYDFFYFALPFLLVFMVISLVLSLLFTYTDYYIVIDEADIMPSIKKSTKLVIQHFRHTVLIFLLMVMIIARIILNIIIIILVPSIGVFVFSYLFTVSEATIAIGIGGCLGMIALLGAAHLSGIFHVFTTTVWTLTFLMLSNEEELSPRQKV